MHTSPHTGFNPFSSNFYFVNSPHLFCIHHPYKSPRYFSSLIQYIPIQYFLLNWSQNIKVHTKYKMWLESRFILKAFRKYLEQFLRNRFERKIYRKSTENSTEKLLLMISVHLLSYILIFHEVSYARTSAWTLRQRSTQGKKSTVVKMYLYFSMYSRQNCLVTL